MSQHQETEPEMVDELRRAIAERRPFYGTLVNYKKGGERFANELIVSPVFGDDGNLRNYVGVQNDVTMRAEADRYGRFESAKRWSVQCVRCR